MLRRLLAIGVALVVSGGVLGAYTPASFSYNEAQVDELVAQAVDITADVHQMLESSPEKGMNLLGGTTSTMAFSSDKGSIIGAFLLCTFLGYLGIHRLYLNSGPGVFIFYLLTGGGCGILTTIDWWVLLFELVQAESGSMTSQYYGCTSLLMISCD